MKPVYTTRSGLELHDEENTPPGEIWFSVPSRGDVKMTYIIMLNDWRIQLQNGDESFLDQLDRWLGELRSTVESDATDFALARIDLIRQAARDFQRGKS